MMDMVRIFDRDIARVTYNEVPVIRMSQIDELHKRPEGTTKRTFRSHRDKFVEDRDYFKVPYKEWSGIVGLKISNLDNNVFVDEQDVNGRNSSIQESGGYKGYMFFFTEHGYLMLVKPLSDDLSWKVQRQLVDLYFRARATKRPVPKPVDDTVSIKTVEYIRLLKTEINLLKVKKGNNGGGHNKPPLSKDEIERIYELDADGYTPGRIAKKIGRSPSTVRPILKYRPQVN